MLKVFATILAIFLVSTFVVIAEIQKSAETSPAHEVIKSHVQSIITSKSVTTDKEETVKENIVEPNAQSIIEYLVYYKNWSKEQATGITANLFYESGFDHTKTGDHRKAHGIAQWHSARQKEFLALFKKDIKKSTLKDQLDFIDYELRQGLEIRAGKALIKSKNPDHCARIFSTLYERPASGDWDANRRAQLAHKLFRNLSNFKEIENKKPYKVASN